MGHPVVHFEIMGKDAPALRSFYSELFEWEIDANNPMNYGVVPREGNTLPDGTGIGGGIGQVDGYDGFVTFYVQVPDVETALATAERMGGTRMMGPEEVMPGLTVGLFTDPEGHTVGVMMMSA